MKDFIFLGGDLRFIYAAAKLNKRHPCWVYGFDKLHPEVRTETGVNFLGKIERRSNVILPLPMSRKCDYITAPYYSGKIPISAVIDAAAPNATVYCGKACPELREICQQRNLTLIDYYEREELTVVNAAITAEGALELIMREKALAVLGMNIMVTGYGRIGKVLSRHLHALGANVTVCARSFADLAWAGITGCTPVHIDDVDGVLGGFDVIVNTVPAEIFDRERLLLLKKDCLLIDLASKAGIEDTAAAKETGVKVIWALSLPGKVAPVSAGEIIADTILNIIAENEAKPERNGHNNE